jgi:serine/threonine protein kinase
MLHRDVKPSNVLLARRDHVYLTDFGLARRVDSKTRLTRQGTVVARAVYVAPEQILDQPVDARSDVYALACLLFETLTGEPPFARWTGGPEALAHLEAPRPSPRALRPELPAAFDDVLRRGMATDPAERYATAKELGEAALAAAGGQRVVAATTTEAPAATESQAAREPAAGGAGLRWAVALIGLVAVAIGMVAALHGISTL